MKLKNGRELTPALKHAYAMQTFSEEYRKNAGRIGQYSHTDWIHNVGQADFLITTTTGHQIRGCVVTQD